MALRKRGQAVTRRTAARRAKQYQAREIAKAARRDKPLEPESVTQANVWDRKLRRYTIAGLCRPCAAQAAWGHAIGFQKIANPCIECQPAVNALPDPGPRGSKWRKCLLKLEYLTSEEVEELFA